MVTRPARGTIQADAPAEHDATRRNLRPGRWRRPKGVLDVTRAPSTQLPLPLLLGSASEEIAADCSHAQAGKIPAPRPRVISASKRTDIPAFYLTWLLKRVEAGWVDVPNPMFRYAGDPLQRLTHVSLRPEYVLAVVWWSKNYGVYERFHEAFARYPVQHFHFTINPRREDLAWIEPDVPPLEEALRQVRFLTGLPGGPDMVSWRYDPLLFWRERGVARTSWDPEFFEHVCRELSALGVGRCFTSLVDRYAKFEQRIKRFFPHISLRDPTEDEVAAISQQMTDVARAYGMQLLACTEAPLARREGFAKGACIDGRPLGGPTSPATDRRMRGREDCGCTVHVDIGDYVTQECGYACVYCYANPSHRRFGPGRARHQATASAGKSASTREGGPR